MITLINSMINASLTPSKNHTPRITSLLFALLMSVVYFPVFRTDGFRYIV